MAKETYKGSINFDTDWGGDASTGNLPVAGLVINNFIRSNLKSSFRDMFFDPNGNMLYFFKEESDKELFVSDPQTYSDLPLKAIPLEFSGTVRQSRLINQLSSTTLNFTTNQTNADVSVQFMCQEKSITDTEWQDTSFGGQISVYVDAGANGTYTEIASEGKHLIAGEVFTLNIRDYIIAGYNTVKLQVVADDDKGTTGTIIYSVYLSEMYIEPLNLNWYTTFVEDDTSYALGGFRIVGALSKTLHIKITKGTHTYGEFEKLIGTSSYITSPLYFLQSDIPEGESMFPNGGSGTYQVDAWLTSGTLESQHVIYPLMCCTTADKNTQQLIAMYNVASKVFNYDNNHLFDVAIYNKGLSSGTPHISVYATNEGSTAATFKDEDVTIATDTPVEYNMNIEWITEATSAINLHVQATYDGSQEMNVIPIDNSGAYPPTSGYSFYLNAANRSNSQSNKTSIINEADGSVITPTWSNMAWVNGIDGWTYDDEGRSCLRMSAGTSVSIPYQVMRSDNIAFDMTFKVSNVADYDENIITIATDPTQADFQGIRIRPTNITIHNSDDVGSSRDVQQGINFSDEETINLFVTIMRNYNGNQGKNLVSGYVNGCKAFQFEYGGNVIWANAAPIVIGSQSSDIYLYSIRAYRNALGVSNAETNYVNSLASRIDRVDAKSKIDSVLNGLHQVDYEKVKNGGYNFFVVEMLNGATVPQRANGWAKDSSGYSNFEMHFGQNPLWDFKLYNVETSGQGTTSMDYYRWNLRFRIDKTNNGVTPKKSVNIAYYNEPTREASGNVVYNELPASTGTKVYFDGGASGTTAQHTQVMRITGKTNSASAMQSHKIGATRAYTSLHDAVVGYNEAQSMADDAGTPLPTVAVYEYPAFGFSKTKAPGSDVYTYEFIGLFTIGPDKGDKPTFGYDKVKDTLLTIEGTDHAPRLATFRYPWNEDVQYRASNECLNIITGNGSDDLEKAWEVSNAHGLGTDDPADESSIQDILEDEMKDAYMVAYNNSTLIHGIELDEYAATASATLAYINANKGEFNATAYGTTNYKYSDLEFWIDGEYILYYDDKKTGLYTAGVNLLEQCGIDATELEGMTVDQKNEYFKAQRREFFKSGNTNEGHELGAASEYWDLLDSEFCFAFLIIFGASDNFAKNSYPYKMKAIADGGRWKWRQDDLDTLFDIDNQGKDTKPYYIEFKDDSNGTPYFNGSNSVFWNLLFECYWNNIREVGKQILDAMRSIGGGQNTYQGILNFVKRMFWDNAQNYFPISAYNEDASYKYEASWLDPVYGQVTVDPLAQSLGNHYSAEYQWVSRRAIYAMSLFHAGPFGIGGYTDSSLGLMSVRATIPSLNLKTAMAFYPAIHVGTNTLNSPDRVMPDGTDAAIFSDPSGGEDTTVYIPATDWITDLGDLKELYVLGDNVKSLSVNGKRLRTFKLGDDESTDISTNIETLTFTNTPSIETVNCKNVYSLGGSIDLRACTRLKTADFSGTRTVSIILPNGSKIEELALSDLTNFLQLKNLSFLTEEGLTLPSSLAGITSLQVEGCKYIDPFGILSDIFDTQNNSLSYIRVVWDGVKTTDAGGLDMLAQIAEDADEGLYHGITPDGQIDDNSNPTIEGDIQVTGGIYTSSLDSLGVDPTETEDWGQGLKRAVAKIFGTMHIIYNPSVVYIKFEDEEVQRICVSNWGDGTGLSISEASSITDIGAIFRGNTTIKNFDELSNFTSLVFNNTNGNLGHFDGCTNLESISLPEGIEKIDVACFRNCSSLTHITIPSSVTSLGRTCFEGSGLSSIVIPEGVTSIAEMAFYNCNNLKTVTIPSSLRTITYPYTFRSSESELETINIASIEGWCRVENWGSTNAAPQSTSPNAAKLVNSNPVTYVSFPSDVSTVKGVTFHNFKQLERIDFNGSITEIGEYAFNNCTSLATIKFVQSQPPVIKDMTVFNGVGNGGTLIVPTGASSNYSSLPSEWRSIANWTVVESDE